MNRNWMWVLIAACICAAVISIPRSCRTVSEDEWRKTKNTIERLENDVTRLNKKCGLTK